MSSSIAHYGELALIERLRTRVGPAPHGIEIGIGDDAAVIAPARGAVDVVTTDGLVEGVHFRREWTSLEAVGHKALAVNLSDLAAMGAMPRAVLLSLALPEDLPVAEFDAIVDGFVALSNAVRAPLVGGNLTRSPGPIVVDVVAIGSVRRRRILRRSTARRGDELFVTGTLGAAAAGLAMLTAGVRRHEMDATARSCVERYERPIPRLRPASIVARSGAATAAMDLSDGLASAARALADASGLGVVIEGEAIPVDDGARAWAVASAANPSSFALTSGEDYELAFAVPPRARRKFLAAMRRTADLPVTRVGRFTSDRGAWLERDGHREPLETGFTHFRAAASGRT